MPERVCKEAIEYPPGKYRNPGDRFDVEENDIAVLVTLGKIEPDVIEQTPAIEGTIRVKRKYTKRQLS